MSIFDNAVSAGVKMAVNHMLAEIGSISQLHLDIKAKTITATAELLGEESTIDFQVGRYELSKKEDGVYITLREISCSREWVQKAIQKFEPEPTVKLPEKLASAVSFAGMVQ